MSRARLEAAIWAATVREYRGRVDGKKAILVLVNGATTLAPLSSLTDEQIIKHLPRALRGCP